MRHDDGDSHMTRTELGRISNDDLWLLHLEISQLLQERIQAEKPKEEVKKWIENL